MFTNILIATIPVIGGFYIAHWQITKSQNRIIAERRIAELSKKLNEFYGPFWQLRLKSKSLYKIFKKDLSRENSEFSTLVHLLQKNPLNQNERTLLKEIIDIGNRTEDLIHEKAGLIDYPMLRDEILPKLTTHYRLISLALDEKLAGNAADYKEFNFPKEVDSLVETRRSEIEAELLKLNKGKMK